MRQVGSSRGAVTAYPRQLESLIRLAEAHARMRLSSKVENVDVEEARRYFLSRKKSCKQPICRISLKCLRYQHKHILL